MSKNYTKYTVEGLGENLNKRKLVFEIVKDYTAKNNPSFEELQKIFPDEIQGSLGFIRKDSEVKDAKRFKMDEPLTVQHRINVVVSNQWGENVANFITCAEKLGYIISKSEGDNIEKSTENIYIKIIVNKYDNKVISSRFVKTNGEYTISFILDSDSDGVIDSYYFYDIKTKSYGENGTPWDFEEFTNSDGEWTEHSSLLDFGFNPSEIEDSLDSMRTEFIENYLIEEAKMELLDKAEVSSNKIDLFKEVDSNGNLVFELGDINIIPLEE
jgi:hypothetical protein